MESIPWYAWIVLVSIVIAGIVQLARTMQSSQDDQPDLRARIVALEERLNRLDRP